jgi:hypothetical protein
LPVGVPLAGGVAATVAVKVTLAPEVDGFPLDVTVVCVEPRATVCVSEPVAAVNELSPE